jgi:hypothetical protein
MFLSSLGEVLHDMLGDLFGGGLVSQVAERAAYESALDESGESSYVDGQLISMLSKDERQNI